MTNLRNLRNIGISAHIDSGKTTLAERMLFYCGRIHKTREVRGKDGGATMDSDPIEKRRGITIVSAVTRVDWKDHVFNVIDTPGHVDFTVEVERSLRVLDGAVLVLCSVGGVQSQSLTVERQMRRYGVPRVAFINKMDRTGADPKRVIDQMRERLKTNAIALQMPIGCASTFEGVIDLITMQAVYFDGAHGEVVRRTEVPEELMAEAKQWRMEMLDALALLDEPLMNTLLSGESDEDPGAPTEPQLRRVIREATIARRMTPVLMGSAFKNQCVQELLDAVAAYLPSPLEIEVFANDLSKNEPAGAASEQVALSGSPESPMVAMAFKTVHETFGQLTLMRVYQGRIEKGQAYRNARTGKTNRFGRLVRMHASEREPIDAAEAGDIVGVLGIECASGDTFTASGCNVALENIKVAEPVIRLSIAPSEREHADRLAAALDRFRRDDPTFQVSSDPETGETLIAGMGQLHLEVYIQRLEDDYGCQCEIGPPRVAYKARPTHAVDFEYRLKKQSGGPGQFAQISGRCEPLPLDCDDAFVFEDRVTGGRIAAQYVPAVRKGVQEALARGPLGGYPVTGMHVALLDGKQHENDSSELAFTLCARDAMREDVLPQVGLVLIEPVMQLEIEIPNEFQGAVMGHLARIRGVVTGSETSDMCTLTAEVPLAELFDYANDVRSMTQGKATFSMEPLEYREVPRSVQDRILSG